MTYKESYVYEIWQLVSSFINEGTDAVSNKFSSDWKAMKIKKR